MRDRRAIYLDLIQQSARNARTAARLGDFELVRLECDHLDNLAFLICSEEEDDHMHYYANERPAYKARCASAMFRASFSVLWGELLDANIEALKLQAARRKQRRFLRG